MLSTWVRQHRFPNLSQLLSGYLAGLVKVKGEERETALTKGGCTKVDSK